MNSNIHSIMELPRPDRMACHSSCKLGPCPSLECVCVTAVGCCCVCGPVGVSAPGSAAGQCLAAVAAGCADWQGECDVLCSICGTPAVDTLTWHGSECRANTCQRVSNKQHCQTAVLVLAWPHTPRRMSNTYHRGQYSPDRLFFVISGAALQAKHLELELEAVRIQLEHLEHSATAHSKALSAFFKHRAKALAAAAQQQHRAAVLHAWQRQAQRQQEAVWTWRELAQLLLQQQPSETCQPSSWYSPPTARGHTQGKLQQGSESAAQEGSLSADPSWEAMNGFEALTSGVLQGTDQQGCSNSANSSSSGNRRVGTFMQRLLQRKRNPEGSCRAAVAEGKLLAAALKAWHMTANIQSRTKRVQQVGGRGCLLFF